MIKSLRVLWSDDVEDEVDHISSSREESQMGSKPTARRMRRSWSARHRISACTGEIDGSVASDVDYGGRGGHDCAQYGS